MSKTAKGKADKVEADKTKKKIGRPKKIIKQEDFEKLCMLQCTEAEICSFFNVTDKTLNAWCRKTYKGTFSEVFRLKRGKGKISLRRIQFQLAEKSAAMAIWLGKQYLGQSDNPIEDISVDDKQEDELSKSLKELAEKL